MTPTLRQRIFEDLAKHGPTNLEEISTRLVVPLVQVRSTVFQINNESYGNDKKESIVPSPDGQGLYLNPERYSIGNGQVPSR